MTFPPTDELIIILYLSPTMWTRQPMFLVTFVVHDLRCSYSMKVESSTHKDAEEFSHSVYSNLAALRKNRVLSIVRVHF